MESKAEQRLLDAAERLFAERGFAATSQRTITQEAGVNVAALNYYFRSKEGLLRAVVGRVMGLVNEERSRRLDELEAGGEDPGVEELIRAFVGPVLAPSELHAHGGPTVARFLGAVLCDPSPEMRRLFAEGVHEVVGRYLQALERAVSHLPQGEVAFRFRAMIAVLGLYQFGTLADIRLPGTPPEEVEGDEERFVAFLVGGFCAPAAVEK